MTIRRDYILRIIEEFFKFLARILKLKGEKQYQQALDLIDEASQSLLHLALDEVENPEFDISLLVAGKGLNLDQLEILAKLLKVKADIQIDMGLRFSAIRHYQQSLYLLEYLQNTSKNFSMERVELMKEISLMLKDLTT